MFGFFDSKVKVSKTTNGSHGDHWGALLSFDESIDMESAINETLSDLTLHGSVKNKLRLQAKYGNVCILGIQTENALQTLYPALISTNDIPVTINEVKEWEHVNGIEGQVIGSGRDTFAVDFFATDYLENSKRYKQGGELPISLTSFAYVIDVANELPENFSDDFCSYMPSTHTNSDNDYDFIGEVLRVEEVALKNHDLVELDIKLIQDRNNENMFNLPMVTHKSNIRCRDINIGDKLSGCFWLQGRIAEKD
ncbi:hypothetical protein [Pleionea sediminis]|uniref:hypothetical protein n=1 Tax=Pleionea sediminis TaxID=2569479 RepID=UPI0011856B75|nr:hypothetical protein [Pleionea sediminis]